MENAVRFIPAFRPAGLRLVATLVLLGFTMVVPAAARAAGDIEPPVVERNKLDAEAFGTLREQIEAEFDTGGEFAEISDEARRQVRTLMDRMAETLSRVDDIDALRENDKIQLFNEQEQVNQLLTAARADSRIKCRRIKRVGTRLNTSVCHTIAEWRLQEEAARDAMLLKQRGPFCTGECSG